MNDKEIKLLDKFLEDYIDELGNNGCSDWDFPKDWTEDEKKEFVREAHKINGDEEEFDEEWLHVPDFLAVYTIKHKVNELLNG